MPSNWATHFFWVLVENMQRRYFFCAPFIQCVYTLTFLDGESFHFYHHRWEQGGNTLEMIWSWENEGIFDKLQLFATKLIEITVGPIF